MAHARRPWRDSSQWIPGGVVRQQRLATAECHFQTRHRRRHTLHQRCRWKTAMQSGLSGIDGACQLCSHHRWWQGMEYHFYAYAWCLEQQCHLCHATASTTRCEPTVTALHRHYFPERRHSCRLHPALHHRRHAANPAEWRDQPYRTV